MKHYGREMNEQKDLNVPRQKILCASRWTPGMREFARVFMQSPLIVVACRYEAAVYGDVQMVSYNRVSSVTQRAREMHSIL